MFPVCFEGISFAFGQIFTYDRGRDVDNVIFYRLNWLECNCEVLVLYPIWTMWALALRMEMGPHKDREKLWTGWELNPRPLLYLLSYKVRREQAVFYRKAGHFL